MSVCRFKVATMAFAVKTGERLMMISFGKSFTSSAVRIISAFLFVTIVTSGCLASRDSLETDAGKGEEVSAASTTQAIEKRISVARRVPAEWEAQEAIWLQWPGRYEKEHEDSFAEMSMVIARYQKLYILHDSNGIRDDARKAISKAGGNPDHNNIVWLPIRNNSAWMRDNGPVFIVEEGEMRIQNWEFDAWGGAFGSDIPYGRDNRVPKAVGLYLDLPVDLVGIVHERGNLEFNGVDTVMLNWSTIGDRHRNPGYTRAQAEADLKYYFGVSRVVFIEGYSQYDKTKGHIDGIARFINPTTVVVVQCTSGSKCKPDDGKKGSVFEAAAKAISAAGFTVIREPIEGTSRRFVSERTSSQGYKFDTNYMNWIVGNGFVIAVGFDNAETDAAAKSRLESYFPGRDVHMIEMLRSWAAGGGAHCHTNDQPAVSTITFNPESYSDG